MGFSPRFRVYSTNTTHIINRKRRAILYCWTMCYNSNGAYADISNTYWAFTPYCCITWCSNPRARGKRGKSLLITDMFTSNLRRQCKARSRIALVKSHNQKLLLKTRPIFASANLPQNVWFKCMCEKKI